MAAILGRLVGLTRGRRKGRKETIHEKHESPGELIKGEAELEDPERD
jgi:hypothetical protein